MKLVSKTKLLELMGEKPFVTVKELASLRDQALVDTKESTTKPGRALSLFGKERFFSQKQVVRTVNPILKARKIPTLRPSVEDPVCYSERTIAEHAGGRWLLFWHPGWSLSRQKMIFGTVPAVQAGFFDSKWWLHEQEAGWAGKDIRRGYHLVQTDVIPESRGKTYRDQERIIGDLGPQYHRPPCSVLSMAVFLCCLINKGERLLSGEGDFHWGTEVDSHGYTVEVGRFDNKGLLVDHDWPDYSGPELGVCPARNEDI